VLAVVEAVVVGLEAVVKSGSVYISIDKAKHEPYFSSSRHSIPRSCLSSTLRATTFPPNCPVLTTPSRPNSIPFL
jgi:hypothetical protein